MSIAIRVAMSELRHRRWKDVSLDEVTAGLIERLKHYFLSYKQLPQEGPRRVEVVEVYDCEGALEVIRRSMEDYRASYGAPENRITELRRLLMEKDSAK